MSAFRVTATICIMLSVVSGLAAQEGEGAKNGGHLIEERALADAGKTFGAFRSHDTALSRWREREHEGETVIVHLGVRRSDGRTAIIETSVGRERLRERQVGSINLGNSRIRRIERGSTRSKAGDRRDSYLLYLTHTGAALSDGLYRVPAGALDPERVLEREELAEFHLSEFGRVADHRAFDVTDTGVIVAAHSAVADSADPHSADRDSADAAGTQLLVHSNGEATPVVALPASSTTVEVRAVTQGERHVLAIRTRGETDVARLRIGALLPESGHFRFDEYANLPGEYSGLYEGGGTGPRSPLGMDTAYRDRGLDAAALDGGSVLVVYQYIEQNLTLLTQPAAGLTAVVVGPDDDSEPERYTLQEVAQNRFAFSPHISTRSPDLLEVVWVVEEHDRAQAGAGIRSDVMRIRVGPDGEPVGRAENVSSTPRKVAEPAAVAETVMWLQSEPRVPGMRPVVAGAPSVISRWLIPAHGNRLETLAGSLFSLPIAVLVGAFDATVLWIGGLALIYALVLALFRFAPDLVRRAGPTVPAAAVLIQLSTYGVPPLSFAGSTPDLLPFLAACFFAMAVLALFRRRLLPEGRLEPTDVMRVVWIASLLFAVQIAYPAVAAALLGLNVVPLP